MSDNQSAPPTKLYFPKTKPGIKYNNYILKTLYNWNSVLNIYDNKHKRDQLRIFEDIYKIILTREEMIENPSLCSCNY